jgi:hypothetical protein
MKLRLIVRGLMLGLAGAGLIAAGGCAHRAFDPPGLATDYDVEVMGTNMFRITFHGERNVPEEQVIDYALLRACHLARRVGASYFATVNQDQSTYDRVVFDTGAQPLSARPPRGLVIKCFNFRPREVFVFKVNSLENILRRKYRPGEKWARG